MITELKTQMAEMMSLLKQIVLYCDGGIDSAWGRSSRAPIVGRLPVAKEYPGYPPAATCLTNRAKITKTNLN